MLLGSKAFNFKAFDFNNTYGFLRVSHSRNPKNIRNSLVFQRKTAIFSCFGGSHSHKNVCKHTFYDHLTLVSSKSELLNMNHIKKKILAKL